MRQRRFIFFLHQSGRAARLFHRGIRIGGGTASLRQQGQRFVGPPLQVEYFRQADGGGQRLG